MRAGIYIDYDNIRSNGGQDLSFCGLRNWCQSRAELLRAEIFVTVDIEAEREDPDLARARFSLCNKMRIAGFLVQEIPLRTYEEDGVCKKKGYPDGWLMIAALSQSDNLDLVVLGTGDGDFLPLVRALQHKGKRVEAFGQLNCSHELRRAVDHYHFLDTIPNSGIHRADHDPNETAQDAANLDTTDGNPLEARNPTARPDYHPSVDAELETGVMRHFDEDKGYGFLARDFSDRDDNAFCHISNVTLAGNPVSNLQLAEWTRHRVQFTFRRIRDGENSKAVDVEPLDIPPTG